MKITKSYLARIIKEEMENLMNERTDPASIMAGGEFDVITQSGTKRTLKPGRYKIQKSWDNPQTHAGVYTYADYDQHLGDISIKKIDDGFGKWVDSISNSWWDSTSLEETDARHLAQAAKGVKDAGASGKDRGPGGMKAAKKNLVKTKNQYHGDKYRDPNSGEEKTRQYGDSERKFVNKRSGGLAESEGRIAADIEKKLG